MYDASESSADCLRGPAVRRSPSGGSTSIALLDAAAGRGCDMSDRRGNAETESRALREIEAKCPEAREGRAKGGKRWISLGWIQF